MYDLHQPYFFKLFCLKLILIPRIHILFIVNIYKFLNSDCLDALNSNKQTKKKPYKLTVSTMF